MVLMATTQIPLVTQVSDIGNIGRMRPKSNVKLTDVILRLEARVTILESLFMCAIPLSHHLAHMTHPFPSPPKQASSTPPLCQPCKLESRDMTCFNPCTLYGHRLSFEWMDGYGGRHFIQGRWERLGLHHPSICSKKSVVVVPYVFLFKTTSTTIPVSIPCCGSYLFYGGSQSGDHWGLRWP